MQSSACCLFGLFFAHDVLQQAKVPAKCEGLLFSGGTQALRHGDDTICC
jgi:hypothetical protein